jgi:hypothetical protein
MRKMFNEGNQIHNLMSSSDSGTVINYGSGSDFLTSFGSGSGSTSRKVTVPTVPVPVPQHWIYPVQGTVQSNFGRKIQKTSPPLPTSAHLSYGTDGT